jgi:protein unc-119
MDEITPDSVTTHSEATAHFLCPLSANIYDIEFVYFKVRDLETGTVLFEVANEDGEEAKDLPNDDSVRTIKYHLGPDFLNLYALGSTVGFKVGSLEVRNFRMIERHYFKNILLKSFDFNLEFCIPGTRNTWEIIYEMPVLSDDLKAQMIAEPWQTKSDSFYFVENKLIMHSKAEYNYSPLG